MECRIPRGPQHVALAAGLAALYASGADDIPDTWLRRYHLMGLFLSLLAGMAVWKLYGPRWSLLALGGLCWLARCQSSPMWRCWPCFCSKPFFRALPEGRARSVVSAGRLVARVVAVLLVLSFATGQLRHGLYPRSNDQPRKNWCSRAPIRTTTCCRSRRKRDQNVASVFARDSGLGNEAQEAMGPGRVWPGGGGNADEPSGLKQQMVQQQAERISSKEAAPEKPRAYKKASRTWTTNWTA